VVAGKRESLETKTNNQPVELKPFGYDIFNAESDFFSAPDVASAEDYILGPGDNLIIYIWGKVEKEFNLTVDRQGRIFIPKAGEIPVWGISLADCESKLSEQLSSIYTDFKLSVSLGKIRSIRIYITGEAKKPGAYTVSSLMTLFNALYLAGGPNERGSMRDIKLLRNNQIEKSVDLYQFLLKGDSKSDVRLSSGDAIFIPVSGPQVTIAGEVKRKAIYELLEGEKVSQLLELAGGTTAEAYLDKITLERISENDERIVYDLNMNAKTGNDSDDIELIDGDKLTISSSYNMKRKVAFIAGMVKHPGMVERQDSTTLKELVYQGELLPENVYYERANLFRRYPDRRTVIIPVNLNEVISGNQNLLLQDLDSLHVYSIDEVKRKKFVYIEGEVARPGQYPLYDGMTLADLIFLAGDLKRNAYQFDCEVARTDNIGRVEIQHIDLAGEITKEVILFEDDRVFIRRIPDWTLHRLVQIDGEVKFPGQYSLLSRNETLYDLINRAGGFADRAFPKGAIFQRSSIGANLVRQKLPEIISNSQPLEEDSSGNIRKVELIKFNIESMNRIIIDMDRIIASNGEKGNVTLQNGDLIYIPEIPSGISVMGSVGANGTIKFEPGKNAKYYVERAGNFTNQADKKNTRLIKADGQVFAGNGTLGKKVDIGDAIVVPTELKKNHDWVKTLSTSVSIIGGVLTSVFIIDRL
jgi:protein involved in polysaccharide export with SLBB domain